jgi:hypothetical protein
MHVPAPQADITPSSVGDIVSADHRQSWLVRAVSRRLGLASTRLAGDTRRPMIVNSESEGAPEHAWNRVDRVRASSTPLDGGLMSLGSEELQPRRPRDRDG